MGKITGGEVSYGRTMKTGDFENKRVDVKLSFSVEDGEDHTAILDAAAKEAHGKAHAMLGIKKPDPAPEPVATSVPQTPKVADKPKAEVKVDKPKAATKGKDALGGEGNEGIPPGLKRANATLETIPDTDGEDAGFNEDAAESQPEISDEALSTAMNRKVAVLKGKHQGAAPKLIKELINTFVEPPKKSHDIPQNLRAQFLKKLEELA